MQGRGMNMSQSETINETAPTEKNAVARAIRFVFLRFGILPFLLVLVLIVFGLAEGRFLSGTNLTNVARQSTFLMIVAMAQALVIFTRGLDLSLGALVGLVTVTAASVMTGLIQGGTDPVLAIACGILAGLGTSLLVGLFNGICVAYIGLNPFITTLASMTALTGLSLTISNGVPIGDLPSAFTKMFSISRIAGLQAPIISAALIFVLAYFLLHHTTLGRYFYAVGSNEKAARLSGISTRKVQLIAYVLASLLTSVAGLLMLARTGTGGAAIGSEFGLQSIAACVIAGVSLFGGVGQIGNVVLGSLFLTLLSNGMNIVQIQSYSQMIVLGCILVAALVGDRVRMRLLGQRG